MLADLSLACALPCVVCSLPRPTRVLAIQKVSCSIVQVAKSQTKLIPRLESSRATALDASCQLFNRRLCDESAAMCRADARETVLLRALREDLHLDLRYRSLAPISVTDLAVKTSAGDALEAAVEASVEPCLWACRLLAKTDLQSLRLVDASFQHATGLHRRGKS